jgi:hypothetical protein
MAARIYSARFDMEVDTVIIGHYEVPVGFVAIVRDMRLYCPHIGFHLSGPISQVYTDDEANVIWEVSEPYADPGVYTWVGRQVCFNVLGWTHYQEDAHLTASGYLLTIPGPPP